MEIDTDTEYADVVYCDIKITDDSNRNDNVIDLERTVYGMYTGKGACNGMISDYTFEWELNKFERYIVRKYGKYDNEYKIWVMPDRKGIKELRPVKTLEKYTELILGQNYIKCYGLDIPLDILKIIICFCDEYPMHKENHDKLINRWMTRKLQVQDIFNGNGSLFHIDRISSRIFSMLSDAVFMDINVPDRLRWGESVYLLNWTSNKDAYELLYKMVHQRIDLIDPKRYIWSTGEVQMIDSKFRTGHVFTIVAYENARTKYKTIEKYLRVYKLKMPIDDGNQERYSERNMWGILQLEYSTRITKRKLLDSGVIDPQKQTVYDYWRYIGDQDDTFPTPCDEYLIREYRILDPEFMNGVNMLNESDMSLYFNQ